jgi:hypothetical protein
MKMSKKDERFEMVDELLKKGVSEDEIIAQACEEFGVKPATVEKDIEALKAQDEPLPFSDDEDISLLRQLLDNKVDAYSADLSAITYKPSKEEQGFVHALIETVTYNNAQPPRKDSKPHIQKFDPKSWLNFAKYHKAQGYTVHKVLHLPKGIKGLDEIEAFGAQ